MNTTRGLRFSALFSVASAAFACGGVVADGADGTSQDPAPVAQATTATATTTTTTTTPTTAASFPFGTYSNCTFLTQGNTFEGEGAPATTLTLAPKGDSVSVTYQADGQPTASFDLDVTSPTSAMMTATGQSFPGTWGYCGASVTGDADAGFRIASPGPAQANLSLTGAALTENEGILFLSLDGNVVDVQSRPGCMANAPASSPLDAMLVCTGSAVADGGAALQTGDGGAGGAATVASSSFSSGVYDCSGTTATVVSASGLMYNGTIGETGTLTLTARASQVTAVISGDTATSGTLTFDLTSSHSAEPAGDQAFDVACGITSASDPAAFTPVTTAIGAGALTTDGSAITLTVLGSVGSSSGTCAGQTSSTTLRCTPH